MNTPFSQRVREGWERFSKEERTLRQLIDQKAGSETIAEQLTYLLSPVFKDVLAEVGFHSEKYDLILNLDGDWSRLFPLTYFQRHAPEEVLRYWDIHVGRQSKAADLENYQICIGGNSVSMRDIQIWTEWMGAEAKVSLYCEKLVPFLQENENTAYWIAYTMLDYAIGELAEIKYIGELNILNAPCEESSLTLTQLLPHFMDRLSLGREELFDAERYCQLYSSYRMQPDEEADDGLRRDVFSGSSCFLSLLNEFWAAETRIMDAFHQNGIAAGYFFYPLSNFTGEERGAQILDFRDDAADRIENLAGSDNFTFIGGATGIYFGYIDFIAWDLEAVMRAAHTVFEKADIEWVAFHSFRQNVKAAML